LTFCAGKRERAQTLKAKLNPIQNVAYGAEPIQKLDIYAPKNAKKMPVLISIHGGGLDHGKQKSLGYFCRNF